MCSLPGTDSTDFQLAQPNFIRQRRGSTNSVMTSTEYVTSWQDTNPMRAPLPRSTGPNHKLFITREDIIAVMEVDGGQGTNDQQRGQGRKREVYRQLPGRDRAWHNEEVRRGGCPTWEGKAGENRWTSYPSGRYSSPFPQVARWTRPTWLGLQPNL